MKNKTFTISCVLLLASLSFVAQTNYSKEVLERIKQVEENMPVIKFKVEGKTVTLEERMKTLKVTGLSIAVINDHKLEWAKGYGWANIDDKIPITTETLFQAASISKSINSVGVLKLVQDKKLDLNTDINSYLKSWKFPYDKKANDKKITIAHLLSHSAGLTLHGFEGFSKDEKKPSAQEILDGKEPAKNVPVRSEFEPGLKFKYSGGGITITQLIVTETSNQDYDKYITETVLNPLEMNNSFYSLSVPKEKENKLACGYLANGKMVSGKYTYRPNLAAGGLWTTPTDLSKYIVEMQLSLEGRSNKVLNQETTKLMLTPYIDKTSALGVFIIPKDSFTYFSHSGGSEGFRSIYYGDERKGRGVVIMINCETGDNIMNEIINSVASVYGWKDFYNPPSPILKKVITVSEKTLSKYPGFYKLDYYLIEVVKGDGLTYKAGQQSWKMNFTTETDFFNLESTSEKSFYSDENGLVKGFNWKNNGDTKKAIKTEFTSPSENILDKYAGKYKEDGEDVTFTKKEKVLFLNWQTDILEAHFISDTEFFLFEDYGALYTFNVNDKGIVEGYKRKTLNEEKMGIKVN